MQNEQSVYQTNEQICISHVDSDVMHWKTMQRVVKKPTESVKFYSLHSMRCKMSAETRIKLDLFSALGEVKRQLEIREGK